VGKDDEVIETKAEQAVEQKKPSLLGIIVEPYKEFERIKNHPRIVFPIILLSIFATTLSGLTSYYLITHTDLFQQMFKQPPGAPPIEPDALRSMSTFILIASIVGSIFSVAIAAAVSALVTWLFVILFQGDVKFEELLSFHIHLYVIIILSLFINTLELFTLGGDLKTSPTSLAGVIPSEGVLKGVLAAFDVFIIWWTILFARGLQVIAKLSITKAWTIAIIFFGFCLVMSIGLRF
jgi:hypothetical protein